MRNEQEMMELILSVAKEDERIRAVYMNGSRTNSSVSKDIFQDYDIVYVVTETDSFLKDEGWIDVFGERLMVQEPDKNDKGAGGDFTDFYGYLMLFTDGNRIDLHIETMNHLKEHYGKDKLTVPLLDKDDCLPDLPEPTDEDYHVQIPTEQDYMGCCNNFWWCQQNVAKSLWRDEVPYAKFMFECVIRRDLDQMVSWWIGMQTDFTVSTGKVGNYFKDFLPAEYWDLYESTYSDSKPEHIWDAMFAAGELFRTLAFEVAERFLYTYREKDDENMTSYLKQVRSLPSHAKSIF
ncbi:aminoglycoside 6-adenylyltransferase [Halobacillus dabanensis]|uniref:Aminoglycoside 6-adenylyltransferase n=1 Tax=Halobacillus dabanensis TaxID=240302 RepID=A0A1I3TIA5_HALDA|nr:aminoglycoside 6-adenylyltransferase [Halobacillus dabanensis]SFJ70350.1 aminoglycoside 6-adenylyltransferase [Halobacillus dabanensis]